MNNYCLLLMSGMVFPHSSLNLYDPRFPPIHTLLCGGDVGEFEVRQKLT